MSSILKPILSSLVLSLAAGCATGPVTLQPVENPPRSSMAPVEYDTPPQAISRNPPRYPAELRQARITGSAVIDFVVDVHGEVTDATTIKANDVRFARAAEAAVRQWRFKPAMTGGVPVACHMQLPIMFTLNGQVPAGYERPNTEPRIIDGPIYDIADVQQQPIARIRISPQYPFELRRGGVQGEAIVDFVVASDGTVANAKAVRATRPQFGDAAVAAVQHWHFRPALVDGSPVSCHMQIPIVFTLNNE